jgi:hypothetical protein
MELLCPECLGALETLDGQSARCTVHGGEFRILFSRWQPPHPPAEQPEGPALAVPEGAVCVQHSNVPAVFLCRNCATPICATCAFPAEGGGQLCPTCVGLPPVVRPAAPAAQAVPEGVRCVQHPHLPAVRQCQSCGAFMCLTCDFALPGGFHVCPVCAAAPKTDLSARRKKLVAGSFALAIWSTIGLAIVMSGALAASVHSKEEVEMLGMALMLLVLLPAIIGMGLGFSAVDRRLVNPPVLWIATIWNILIVGGFLLLCLIGIFK